MSSNWYKEGWVRWKKKANCGDAMCGAQQPMRLSWAKVGGAVMHEKFYYPSGPYFNGGRRRKPGKNMSVLEGGEKGSCFHQKNREVEKRCRVSILSVDPVTGKKKGFL